MMKKLSSLVAVPMIGALAVAGPALADESRSRAFPADRLEPAVDSEGIANTEWAGVPDHFGWDAALWLGYENDPLFTYTNVDGRNPLERKASLIENRLHSELTLALALFNWVQIGLEVPFLLNQSRDDSKAPEIDTATPVGTMGFGDMAVLPKVRILRQQDSELFDLAFTMPITLPTGAATDYFGEGGVTFAPGLAASREWGHVRAAFNIEHRFRDTSKVLGLAMGNELLMRGGVAYRFDVLEDRPTEVGIGVSSFMATDGIFRDDNSPVRNPVEVLVDVQHKVWGPIDVFFGGGAGLVSGYGVPDYRLFGGVRLADRPPADYDEDGLVGPADHCPKQPETKNGFEDEDGCPDAGDDDKDGISNDKDKCVSVPEDKDGFEDDDGCPDDNDNDGIADVDDKCVDKAEDKDNFEDTDGCPDTDNDNDGIADTDDKCPNEAEDKDGFEDTDGCPEADNDKDGILDAADACPVEAGPKVNKGCPDKDRDNDTVVDRLDNCPDEPGTPENGGCAEKQLVVITDAKLEIKDRVYFKTGKDVIESKSFPLLDNIAAVLKSHPEIKVIRVEGHTDNVGDAAKNKDLSQRRAASVKKYLVEKGGIDAARLEPVGYGQEKPVADNATDDGKQQNRRVEFVIVDDEAAAPAP
jgi:outer membrane protein OmpA-like peptidoglycan-associated protein